MECRASTHGLQSSGLRRPGELALATVSTDDGAQNDGSYPREVAAVKENERCAVNHHRHELTAQPSKKAATS